MELFSIKSVYFVFVKKSDFIKHKQFFLNHFFQSKRRKEYQSINQSINQSNIAAT